MGMDGAALGMAARLVEIGQREIRIFGDAPDAAFEAERRPELAEVDVDR